MARGHGSRGAAVVAVSIAVVCESSADLRTGCDLADRVVCEAIAWLEAHMLGCQREWRGLEPTDEYLRWAAVRGLARTSLIPIQGFGGKPAKPDAHAARKALWLLHASDRSPDAVLFLRDDDGDINRREGLDQARRYSKFDTPIVIGVAHPKRECWVLAGFDPQNDQERDRLAHLRSELGFDTREKAERLTAKQVSAKRSAKRVLNALTRGDPDREAECWQKTDLQLLATRGQNTGLAQYLDEVRIRMVPLFTWRPPAS